MREAAIIVLAVIVALFLLWAFTPYGRGIINRHSYEIQKVDDATSYKMLKQVEDTARAMISSYEADKLMYDSVVKIYAVGYSPCPACR